MWKRRGGQDRGEQWGGGGWEGTKGNRDNYNPNKNLKFFEKEKNR